MKVNGGRLELISGSAKFEFGEVSWNLVESDAGDRIGKKGGKRNFTAID